MFPFDQIRLLRGLIPTKITKFNVLSGKMDEFMKLFATKSAPIDPNDMPLSTLIENNNESMDVNFVN